MPVPGRSRDTSHNQFLHLQGAPFHLACGYLDRHRPAPGSLSHRWQALPLAGQGEVLSWLLGSGMYCQTPVTVSDLHSAETLAHLYRGAAPLPGHPVAGTLPVDVAVPGHPPVFPQVGSQSATLRQ